jgi:mannose-6-phosphate isomerase-like protein (cupin superfamily)
VCSDVYIHYTLLFNERSHHAIHRSQLHRDDADRVRPRPGQAPSRRVPHLQHDRHGSERKRLHRLEPGAHIGVHTDSAEEFLIVLEGTGEGLVGDEVAPVEAGQVVVMPAMVRHDMTNTGTELLRVFGTFASSTIVATFEEPLAPGGPQVFVIGAPMPILLPLEAEPALA